MAAYECKCGVKGIEHFYSSSKYYCKTCWNKLTHQKQKQKFVDYLNEFRQGIKCERCGYDKGLWALAFHHRDPSLKDFSIDKNRGKNKTELYTELDKCDVLCHNCHSEVHAEMRGDI